MTNHITNYYYSLLLYTILLLIIIIIITNDYLPRYFRSRLPGGRAGPLLSRDNK